MGQEELALTDSCSSSDSLVKPLRKRTLSLVSSRDEMNLAEFPLAVLSTRANPKIKTLEFADTQRMPSGDVLERKWIITGADKFGLPTSTDDDVVLGLVCLTMDQGFRDRKVYFTRYELLKILRWSTEGKSYARLTKSLDRLSGVRVKATNSFYDNSLKAYQTRNFGLIDAYEINDERGAGRDPNSYFIRSEVLFESFSAGFIKKIDLDFYFQLKSAVSRRLYRYLDKHFYYKHTVEKSLTLLAFEKLGLSRNYKYASSIKQQLKPACEELISKGFLSSYEFSSRNGEPTVKFIRRSKSELLSPSGKPKSDYTKSTEKGACSLSKDQLFIKTELTKRGLTEGQVVKLIIKKNSNELKQIINILGFYDYLLKTRDPRVSRNPVGFLYRAVESPFQFQVPESFYLKKNLSNTAIRPERRLISKRGQTNYTSKGQNDAKRHYQVFVEHSIDSFKKRVGNETLLNIRSDVEKRMSCLKSVLGDAKYKEAIEGLVKEELIKKAKIPDYDTWINSLSL